MMRVMLIDDHSLVRAGLKQLLATQSDIVVVAEANRVDGALEMAQKSRAEIVVLDLTLPGGASLPFVAVLRRETTAKVLILTMHDDPAYARAALAAGALGYVVKSCPESVLLEALQSVSRGRLFIDLDNDEQTGHLWKTLMQPGISGDTDYSGSKLSSRETEVLRMLGQGLSNLVIAERLELSPKTVATYRARIAEKVGLKTTADFVKYARDIGFETPELP